MHKNRTYVVTGAASGIGAETVHVLKDLGGTVIGVDLKEAKGVDQFYQADLTDAAAIDRLIADLPEGTHGLANIAGLPPTAPAEAVIKVNLTGLIRLTDGLAPKLAKNGRIVNLASLAGVAWPENLEQVKRAVALSLEDDIAAFCTTESLTAGNPRSYFLSKEALIVWTMQNRWTWRDRGIVMNAVSPGPVETPILQDFVETLGDRAEEDMRVMDRPGRPEDIAPVVSFLLSDGAGWLRGENIESSGGMRAHIYAETHRF